MGSSSRVDIRKRRSRAGSQRATLAAVVIVGWLLVVSCGSPAELDVASADQPRVPTTDASADPAIAAVNALAADLYGRLAAEPENLVFSPYSVEIALAMARNGARGETRIEMDSVLGAPPGEALDAALNVLDQQLAGRPGRKGDDERNGNVELSNANAIFGQRDTSFGQTFLDLLAGYYGAGIRLVDYKSAAESARREINKWVEGETKDRIVDLLPEGSLDALTRLVITNAIYFKAPWVKRFLPLESQPFTRPDGTVVRAPAMSTSKIGTYRQGPGWRAAEIPYLGEELSMVVIVPDELTDFESSLDAAALNTIISGPGESLATFQMPKFEFRTNVSLKPALAGLGMPTAFDETRADFSAITTDDPLFIHDVYHQGFISVDEEGTEAAAATAVVVEAVSGPVGQSLVVDRPFLFAIRDVTGAILFLGRVTDPTVS